MPGPSKKGRKPIISDSINLKLPQIDLSYKDIAQKWKLEMHQYFIH